MSSENPPPVFAPVSLSGQYVRLLPLEPGHLPALTAAGSDPEIWRWVSVNAGTPDGMRAFVEDGLDMAARGTGLAFTVTDAASGEIVGSTRFAQIERAHRRAEIGWTWLAPRVQRSGINTEMKYLMLRHAFEQWGLARVEFKTDSLNEKSRRALARIGATEEGTLRNHMTTWSGRVRHSVYFSVIAEEWPRVKQRLEALLRRPGRSEGAPAAPDPSSPSPLGMTQSPGWSQ